jgi:hypothetical protein
VIFELFANRHRRILGATSFTDRYVDFTSSQNQLTFSQILDKSSALLTGLSKTTSSAPVGVNPGCGTLKAGSNGSLGNIANIIACGLSIIGIAGLIVLTTRRKAAVGELNIFLD